MRTTLIMMAGVVCSGVFAIPLFQPDGFLEPRKNGEVQECPNFTGKWKGQCEAPTGETNEMELDVYQHECEFIQLSNLGIPINGISSQTISTSRGTGYQLSMSGEWKKKSLHLTGNLLSIGHEKKPSRGGFESELYLEGGELMTHIKSNHVMLPTLDCKFHRSKV